MRRIARRAFVVGATLGVASTAFGQVVAPPAAKRPPQAEAKPPADEAAARREMERLLGLWEQQSARLKSLDVSFTRLDKAPGWNQVDEFRGRAYLQSPNLVCLHFQKVDVVPPANKPTLQNYERIVCTGKEVLQYDYQRQQIFRFPLDKQQRQRALQEGPLPFLFNMKAAEAKERYGMTYINQNEKAYLIGVVPHKQEDRDVFSKAFIQLSKSTFLPDRLLLLSPNGKDTQDYTFSGISANGQIDPQYFQQLQIKGWKLIDNPSPQQQPQAAPRAVGRQEAAPAGRPATRARQ